MKIANSGELITQTEAARLRGIRRESIYDLVARGRLRVIEKDGKKFLLRSEVENFQKLAPYALTKTKKKSAKKSPKKKG